MAYYAHKREAADGKLIRQTVHEHLVATAQTAARCLHGVGLENTGYLAGLLHDMGKYTEAFRRYLDSGDAGKRSSVVHTFQGCRYMLERYRQFSADFASHITSELIAFAVAAHHGLFDCVDSTQRIGLKYRCEKEDISYDEALSAFCGEISVEEIDRLFSKACGEIDEIFARLDENYPLDSDFAFEIGLLARLILSAVIEGDRSDTAAFMNDVRTRSWPEDMTPIWKARLDFMEEKLKAFSCNTPVSLARQDISEACRAFAPQKPGIYRLNVPTGGGKTLSSLRYALAHAMHFNKRRLIFCSPLLSILEQNASVIHEYVGDDSLILEHHSNVVQTWLEKNELDERELLVQSWDAPIIITTLVQLLNTMFDGKTTAIRRFQALCGSVIVIDEVQSVPVKLLTLFNLTIEFLSELCGATVILCSATQPELESAQHPLRLTPKEIVPRDERLWAVFRRTELKKLPDMRFDELSEIIRAQMDLSSSLLVVCNKKDEAARLLQSMKSSEYRSFHLSAAMCMQNRREVLSELQAALGKGEKLLCISTQVIEAGVDISFGTVIRLAAGMDSIVQAAGRCNRSGESEAPRPVYIINCSDESLINLRDIQRGKDASLDLMNAFEAAPERFDGDIVSDAAIRYYYRAYYREMDKDEQDYPCGELKATLFDLMAMNSAYADAESPDINSFLLHQAFKTAGQYFSVFDEDSTDVLVPYGRGKELIAELCSERCRFDMGYRAFLLKEASNYTVSVYHYQRKKLIESGALLSACDDSVFILAEDFYDDTLGITINAKEMTFQEV